MIKQMSIILLLLISLTLAADMPSDSFSVTLKTEEIKTVEGHIIELKAVGASGSVYVKVDGEESLVENNVGDTSIKGIQVGIISSSPHPATGGEATLRITIPKSNSCISDTECDDKDMCTTDICTTELPRICIHEGSTCEFNGTCVPHGSIDGQKYCSLNSGWTIQKGKDEVCSEDYECKSQNCIHNVCGGFLLDSNNDLNIKNWILITLATLIVIKLILIIISPRRFIKLLGFLIFILALIALLIYFFLK